MPLPYNWGGLYLGGYVGYLWGRTRVEEDGLVTEPNAATNGVIGGVLAGYNRQAGPGVFGVEGDFGWTDAHGTGLVSNPIIQPNTYDVNWTGQCVAASDMHSTPGFFSLRADLSSLDFNFHEARLFRRFPAAEDTTAGRSVAVLRWRSCAISSAG
ncbi:MAG: hypothetical protein WCD29_11795, partial [Pseudolabrys sp.]